MSNTSKISFCDISENETLCTITDENSNEQKISINREDKLSFAYNHILENLKDICKQWG